MNTTNENQPEFQIRRSGIKSSEGILTAVMPLVVMAITWAVKRYDLDVEPVELATMLLTIGGAAAAYIHSRGQVKVSRNVASGAAAAMPSVAVGGDVNAVSARGIGDALKGAALGVATNYAAERTGFSSGNWVTATPGVPFPEDGDFSDAIAFDLQARALLEQEKSVEEAENAD